jgi:glutathione S-transferase
MMLTLFSYPELYGLPDNNPYGLKVYAFLRLCGLEFRHEHIFDAKAAPRGQLPYVVDDGETIGDSNEIVDHLITKHSLAIDVDLSPAQQTTDHLLRRMLDDLYWVMSYSRWQDPRYWPTFRAEILRTHAQVTEADLEAAKEYNGKRYYYQGIGRYMPEGVYKRGLADLGALASLLGTGRFLFGQRPYGADAGCYGFLANIYYYPIDTPLRQFIVAHSELSRYCEAMHAAVTEASGTAEAEWSVRLRG